MKNTIFTQIKKVFLKIFLINTLYFKYYFKFQLKLIWFFTDTVIGYCFYLFCVIYGISGMSSNSHGVLKAWCFIFALIIAGLTIQTYIALKIPSTKMFLENWIGKEYIVAHLGEYTTSRFLIKTLSTVSPILMGTIAEGVTKAQDASINLKCADEHMIRMHANHEKSGIPVDSKTLSKSLSEANQMASRSAKGIITKGIESVSFDNAIDKISDVFTKK